MSAKSSQHSPVNQSQSAQSSQHSPVPYLFGGLAAVLGLIAFALVVLACSYRSEEGERSDGEDKSPAPPSPAAVVEEKFLVIMAGQHKPTYLATPMSSRASSFGSSKNNHSTSCSSSSTCNEVSSVLSEEAKDAEQEQVQRVIF